MSKTLAKWQNDFPVLFDDFFKPWNEWYANNGPLNRAINLPAVNIAELDNEYALTMAVPGLKKEDIRIDVEDQLLTISSEKEENREEKEKRFTRKEYNYSAFRRSFSLPAEVSIEKIDATCADGVLKISIPKKEGSKKIDIRQIAVK